jgi:hypothetical protein
VYVRNYFLRLDARNRQVGREKKEERREKGKRID